MHPDTSRRSTILQSRRAVAALYVLLTITVFVMWVWSADTPTTAINGDPRSRLSDLIYGRAHNPYVQRALVSILTRTVYAALPESLWLSLTQPLRTLPKTQKEIRRLGWEEEFFPEYLIALAITVALVLPFPFIARRLWKEFYAPDDGIAALAGAAPLIVVPTFFHTGPHYIYDLPALTLFTAGLLLLVQRRWQWYYVLFAVSCINKETTVLLLFAFLVLYRKLFTTPVLLRHTAVHLFLFSAGKLSLMHAFADNPGPTVAFQLYGNLHRLLLGYSWSEFLVAGVTVFLIVYHLHTKPPALVHLSLLVVPFGVLMLFFGVLPELRAVYELLPVLTFMTLHTICFDLLKRPYAVKTFP